QNYFTPSSSQWRTDSIDLANYSNESNLQIAFRNIGRYGNVVYLDNVNIDGFNTLIESSKHNFYLYPNPVRKGKVLAWNSTIEEPVVCVLLDSKGKIIFNKQLNGNQIIIPENLKAGNYFIQFQFKEILFNRSLVIIE
ncbi:MAG: T9SS type A sorting domain-containing protein, partial [Bacteroidetes bacterium]|nr:T9SS type A sorting domain-containing protein [Bacteroidota bacterium]